MARLPFDGRYRVGPHGSYGFHRVPGNGRPENDTEDSWHFAVDMYPANLEEYARAPERVTVVGVRTSSEADGTLKGYGPGALRLRSEGPLLSDTFGWLRVWHTYGHLRPADVARFEVGQVLDEGTPLGRVFVPQYSSGWRHLHYEIWKRASVPAGKDRGPHTYHPERWAGWRGTVDAAVTAGGIAAAAAVARGTLA